MRYLIVVLALLVPTFARANSSSLLDVRADGTRLAVANTDNDSITIVNPKARKALREIKVGDHPEGAAWVGNTSTVIVPLNGESAIAFADADSGDVFKLKTAFEPYGVVVRRDGRTAYVSHDFPGLVSVVDVASRTVTKTIRVGQWSRGLALSADETKLYVTNFYTAELVCIDLAKGEVADRWTGQSTENLCRHVELHPRRDKAYLSHIRSRVEVHNARGSIFPQLTICDLRPKKDDADRRRRSIAMDTYNGVYVVANSWESAVAPDGRKIYTLYAGSEEMNVSNLLDDDYTEAEAIGRVVKLGKNPRAIRVSPDGKEVYVYNTLDFNVAVLMADSLRAKPELIEVCKPAHSPEWVRGKFLFHTASPPMSGARWVACASCHPDGLSDNRVWSNPDGLRKTPPLFGLAHTHPLHWSADRDEVQDFEYTIRGPLMRGRGLIPEHRDFSKPEVETALAGKSKDIDALAVYTNSFHFKLSPFANGGQLSESAVRGKELFFDKAVNCSSCHSGPYYTDSSLKKPYTLHDVGTGHDDAGEKLGPKYDTPTLLGVYRSAPYLHHGKAATLMDVLTTCNPKDQHGMTSQLTAAQKEDVVEFLKALPYELPPDKTPNTVEYYEPRK